MQFKQQVSRADLLHCLKASSSEEEQVLVAELLGYELPWRSRKAFFDPDFFPQKSQPALLEPQPSSPSQFPQSDLEQRPPAIFYALTEREAYQNEEEAKLPKFLQGVEPLTTADLQPWELTEPLAHQTILPESRLVPFVQNSLHLAQGQYLDLKVLVKRLARLQTLHRLPKAPRQVVSGRLYVLLDASRRLRPFWDDMAEVAALIKRKYGRVGLELRVIEACPPTRYIDWLSANSIPQAWQHFTSPSTVLVLSDLGQLTAQDSLVRQQWLRFIQSLQQTTCRVYALSPVSPEQQDLRFRKWLTQVLWNRNSPLKPQASQASSKLHSAKVERVLGLISAAVHVEPELLRAILQCLPSDQADSGVEAAVYQHAAIHFGSTAISLKADERAAYQALFKAESADLQQQVIALLRQQHISQFPAVWAEEVLMLVDLVEFALPELEQAQTFLSRFTSQLSVYSDNLGMRQFAKRHLQRLGAKGEHSDLLYGLAYREELRQGQTIPAGFDARVVQSIAQQATAKTEYFLVQLGEELWLKPLAGWSKDYPFSLLGSPLAALTLETSILTLKQGQIHKTLAVQTERALWILEEESEFELETGRERLSFTAIIKPAWATRIWRNSKGLVAALPWRGEELDIVWQPATEAIKKGYWDFPAPFDEDEFGLYVDVEIKSVITQRFRFIPAGSFLMGSPKDEPERSNDETQHPVTLSQGFWLADITVTQELWQVVMGNNPSYFKDSNQLPVEEVSWDEAQAFIQKLKVLMPQLPVSLPTEAQWEYACRAGTTTPFSFGENITPEQVNYQGEYPYHNGKKGLYREKTVAVKSLPPNEWGLHEMHGNVWEWCEDVYQSNLGDVLVIDPVGALASASGAFDRVLRGGSWYDHGRSVRSAYRLNYAPVNRRSNLGFRLALGHIELKRVAEQRDISGDVLTGSNIQLALSRALLEVEPTQQRSTKKRRKKGKSDKYSPPFP